MPKIHGKRPETLHRGRPPGAPPPRNARAFPRPAAPEWWGKHGGLRLPRPSRSAPAAARAPSPHPPWTPVRVGQRPRRAPQGSGETTGRDTFFTYVPICGEKHGLGNVETKQAGQVGIWRQTARPHPPVTLAVCAALLSRPALRGHLPRSGGGTPAPAVSAVVSTRPVGVQDVLGHAPDTRRHPLGTACGCCCCNATYISVLIITITAVTSQPGPEEIHKPELVSTHVQMGTQRLPCPLRPQCLSTPSPSSTHTLTLKSILGDSLGDAALSRIPFSPRVLRCLRNPGGPGFERTTRKARGKSTDTVPGSSPCAERVKVVWPWSLVLPRSV